MKSLVKADPYYSQFYFRKIAPWQI